MHFASSSAADLGVEAHRLGTGQWCNVGASSISAISEDHNKKKPVNGLFYYQNLIQRNKELFRQLRHFHRNKWVPCFNPLSSFHNTSMDVLYNCNYFDNLSVFWISKKWQIIHCFQCLMWRLASVLCSISYLGFWLLVSQIILWVIRHFLKVFWHLTRSEQITNRLISTLIYNKVLFACMMRLFLPRSFWPLWANTTTDAHKSVYTQAHLLFLPSFHSAVKRCNGKQYNWNLIVFKLMFLDKHIGTFFDHLTWNEQEIGTKYEIWKRTGCKELALCTPNHPIIWSTEKPPPHPSTHTDGKRSTGNGTLRSWLRRRVTAYFQTFPLCLSALHWAEVTNYVRSPSSAVTCKLVTLSLAQFCEIILERNSLCSLKFT